MSNCENLTWRESERDTEEVNAVWNYSMFPKYMSISTIPQLFFKLILFTYSTFAFLTYILGFGSSRNICNVFNFLRCIRKRIISFKSVLQRGLRGTFAGYTPTCWFLTVTAFGGMSYHNRYIIF